MPHRPRALRRGGRARGGLGDAVLAWHTAAFDRSQTDVIDDGLVARIQQAPWLDNVVRSQVTATTAHGVVAG